MSYSYPLLHRSTGSTFNAILRWNKIRLAVTAITWTLNLSQSASCVRHSIDLYLWSRRHAFTGGFFLLLLAFFLWLYVLLRSLFYHPWFDVVIVEIAQYT